MVDMEDTDRRVNGNATSTSLFGCSTDGEIGPIRCNSRGACRVFTIGVCLNACMYPVATATLSLDIYALVVLTVIEPLKPE